MPQLSPAKSLFTWLLAWENSQRSFFATPLLVSLWKNVWGSSTEITIMIKYQNSDLQGTSAYELISWRKISTNQKHYPDLSGDASSVRNVLAHSSVNIWQWNQWCCREMPTGLIPQATWLHYNNNAIIRHYQL